MSTRNLTGKIMPLFMLLALIVITVSSCRKNDAEYTPIPPDPANPSTPQVFANRPLFMMTPDEISNHTPFPGHMLRQCGKGLVGGIGMDVLNQFEFVGSLVFSIYSYATSTTAFDQIDQSLTNLTNQVNELNGEITQMNQNLNIQMDDLKTFISNQDLQTQIKYVENAMSAGTEDDFMFWAETANRYKLDSTNPANIAAMNNLQAYALTYASNNYHNTSSNGMQTVIGNIFVDVCTGDQVLHNYTTSLINACNGNIKDSADADYAYRILESIFLQIVNYQFQAATIMVNSCNMLDPTGDLGYTDAFWNAYVVNNIQPEVGVFLQCVDYLAASLGEYRNQTLFQNDMQYTNSGLTPNGIFKHALARSQFLGNLIYDALGVKPPVICGQVILPKIYNPNITTFIDSLTVQIGPRRVTSNATTIQSPLPYTYWNGNTCASDCNWRVYRFTCPDTVWNTVNAAVTVSTSNPDAMWVHNAPVTGNVTPLWYNPRNPSQSSPTKTDSCTVNFAFLSAGWPWGYQFLSQSQPYMGFNSTNGVGRFDFQTFNNTLANNSNNCAVGWMPINATYQNEYENVNQLNFNYPYYTVGSMTVTGNTTATKGTYIVANNQYCTVNPSGVTASPTNNPTLSAWAVYNVYYSVGSSTGAEMMVNIGTTLPTGKCGQYKLVTVGSDVVSASFPNANGTTNSGFGASTLKLTSSYNPGFQFYYQLSNYNTVAPVNIRFNTACQFVFGGFYNLP